MDSRLPNGLLFMPMIKLSDWVHRNTAYILIGWIVLAALCPSNALRPLYLFTEYLTLPAVLLLLLPRTLKVGARAFRPDLADYAMVLFTVLAVASILLGRETPAAAFGQLKAFWRAFLGPFVLYWIARLSRPDKRQLMACTPILAGLCIIEAVVGALGIFNPAALPGFWPSFVNETGGIRITGTLVQPDSYAAMLIFSSSMCFSFLMARSERILRVLGCGLLVLGFSAAVISFSRASWLGGLLALGMMAFYYRGRILIPCALLGIAVFGIFHIPAGTTGIRTGSDSIGSAPAASAIPHRSAPGNAESYAMKRLSTKNSVSDRIALSAAGLSAFLQHPLFGSGMGSYDQNARKLVRKIGPFIPSDWALTVGASHNSHISILAELGMIGYACFVVPLIYIFYRSIQALRHRNMDGFLVVLWANLLFLALVSVLIDMRFLAGISGLAGLVLGLTAVRLERNESPR
jgi:O-antigen ligase